MLGAPGTGAAAFAQRLRSTLASHPEWTIIAPEQAEAGLSLVLLMGLPASNASADTRHRQAHADSALRTQLQTLGLPFRVVYGQGREQLSNALLALGLPPDEAAQVQREQAQFDLNRGRTPWSCEHCSDPACEHRLFTGLLRP